MWKIFFLIFGFVLILPTFAGLTDNECHDSFKESKKRFCRDLEDWQCYDEIMFTTVNSEICERNLKRIANYSCLAGLKIYTSSVKKKEGFASAVRLACAKFFGEDRYLSKLRNIFKSSSSRAVDKIPAQPMVKHPRRPTRVKKTKRKNNQKKDFVKREQAARERERGFGLVEIMLLVGIMLILTAIIILYRFNCKLNFLGSNAKKQKIRDIDSDLDNL